MNDIEIYEISDITYSDIYEEINNFVHKNDKSNKYGFDEWDLEYIEEMTNLNTSEIYVMYEGDEIIGVSKIDLFDGYIYLSDILISENIRNKGYGRMFIEKILEETESLEIDLNVDCRNTDAIIFYLIVGFEIIGYVSKYYENEFSCIYMMYVKEE